VVTGHDAHNVAKVLIDAPATNAKYPQAGTVSTMMWCTDGAPATIPVGDQIEDMGARILGTPPPAEGTRFTVIDFPPGNHPRMHRTETVDYVIVMEGEIEIDMDASTVKLKAGDIMIQRGTNHAWANRGDKRARIAFVLVDAEPLGIGKPILGQCQRAVTCPWRTTRQRGRTRCCACSIAPGTRLLRKGAQLARPAGVPELLQRLRLNLPNALARHAEDLPHLFERMISCIADPKAHAQNALFARGQLGERLGH